MAGGAKMPKSEKVSPSKGNMMNIAELKDKTIGELHSVGKELGIVYQNQQN